MDAQTNEIILEDNAETQPYKMQRVAVISKSSSRCHQSTAHVVQDQQEVVCTVQLAVLFTLSPSRTTWQSANQLTTPTKFQQTGPKKRKGKRQKESWEKGLSGRESVWR
jgi:hypothetical protein